MLLRCLGIQCVNADLSYLHWKYGSGITGHSKFADCITLPAASDATGFRVSSSCEAFEAKKVSRESKGRSAKL
ncbi:unnamed protein product [Calypogeia fissa]